MQKEQSKDISKAIIDRPTFHKHNKLTNVPRARLFRQQNFDARTHQQLQQEHAQLIHNTDTGEYLNCRQLLRDPKQKELWEKYAANEFSHLAQGVGTRITKEDATNTINFILKDDIPKERTKDVTYGSFNCDYKPNKEEKWRTRLTAGGDRINYPFDCGTPTADMTLFKIIVNSTISTKGAKCMMVDLSNFYLKTRMARREYMHLKIMDILEEIMKQYKLRDIITTDDYVYCEINKGMYGLPQSGIIAQQLLEERLSKVGYTQSKIIPGLWKHHSQAIIFCLVVDDFAIKY
jgi:hypothetical protein